ncbi:MAG TPA: hypothetical protein VG860_05585 [Terriglobia bacterium]|jgi:hypothetical protein|nr:hypothetical protein [Terriglobia bacterium]
MTLKKGTPSLLLIGITLLACGLVSASPRPQTDAQTTPGLDRRSGFGRPESISGTISLVSPEEGLLIVTKQGPGQPASTNVTGTTVVTQNPDGTTSSADTSVSMGPGPGETDYRFRVTGNTLIRLDGRPATLRDLAGVQDKQATVHFIPERNGNFAKGIEVGP